MLKNSLVFKFEEKDTEFSFTEKLNVIHDEKLIKSLGRENIKNGNSTLQIKSLNSLPIYEVIQIKINLLDTGTFLINFEKDKIDENTRNNIIEKIRVLKDDAKPTKELQIEKIKKLLAIIEEFHPIYVAYRNSGIIKTEEEDLIKLTEEVNFNFPLLFLYKLEKVKKERNAKIGKLVIGFPPFRVDYIFLTIFSILLCFELITGIFKYKAGESIAAFLFVMAAVYLGIIYFIAYSVTYRKTSVKNKNINFWLILYIIIGVALGTLVGWVVCKYALKTEDIVINYKKIILISILVSLGSSLLALPCAPLINLIVKKAKNN